MLFSAGIVFGLLSVPVYADEVTVEAKLNNTEDPYSGSYINMKNSSLSGLSVSGVSLEPAFRRDQLVYIADLPSTSTVSSRVF